MNVIICYAYIKSVKNKIWKRKMNIEKYHSAYVVKKAINNDITVI